MLAELSFVLSQFTRVTDRRTDRQIDTFAIRKTALHTMQRGKNVNLYSASSPKPLMRCECEFYLKFLGQTDAVVSKRRFSVDIPL